MIKSHPYFPLVTQIFRFGIVGLVAAGVHFSAVVILVENNFFSPLAANIIGFMFGFQVSYWGHKIWTFKDRVSLHREAYPRLILVQLLNLAANQFLFYIFLTLGLPYPIALCCVLMILPIFTFISSKWWVFRSS